MTPRADTAVRPYTGLWTTVSLLTFGYALGKLSDPRKDEDNTDFFDEIFE